MAVTLRLLHVITSTQFHSIKIMNCFSLQRVVRAIQSKGLFLIVLSGMFLIFNAQRIKAYDNDTHFWLTYYLAIKSGYSSLQAAQIASATISVDFDSETTPVLPYPNFKFDVLKPSVYVQNVRIYLHALPLRQSVVAKFADRWKSNLGDPLFDPTMETDQQTLKFVDGLVLEQQNYRWNEVLKYKDNPGVFLHYLQDKYAHKGFFSIVGHAGYEYVDFLASDPQKAEVMVRDTVNYLLEFKKIQNGAISVNPTDETANNWQQIDATTWSEINSTLKRFIEANPSQKIEETQLLNKWVEAKNKIKPSVLKELYRRWKNAKLPDSYKARVIVQEQLKMNEKDMPHIWFYDLRQGGFPIGNTETYSTSKIRTYRKVNYRENLKKERAKNQQGKLLCLPWKVFSFETSEIPICRN